MSAFDPAERKPFDNFHFDIIRNFFIGNLCFDSETLFNCTGLPK